MAADSTQTPAVGHAILVPHYELNRSPIYRAVWESVLPRNEFAPRPHESTADVLRVADGVVDIVQRRWGASKLRDADGYVSEQMLSELGAAGFWGMPIDPQFGGFGATFHEFCGCLTRVAAWDAAVAGLGNIHNCIGPASAIRHFGTDSQQSRWLPVLARGDRRAAFALTEPAAGTDLSALRTTARRADDHFVVNGEKAFISNLAPGRLIALVCQVDGQPQVLICDLPARQTEHFQLVEYKLCVQRHMPNCGMQLRDFRVPLDNLLASPRGSGLTIVYHGLNRGRIALAATAAGSLRRLLADMTAWIQYRVTHGKPLAKRGLIQYRLGRLASLIVACDALVTWSASLIDRGYRGELEAIVAKVFASDALREATIELALATHGGRAFLAGHGFADHVLDYLATRIYEGEGDVLSLALVHALWTRRPPGTEGGNAATDNPLPAGPLAGHVRSASQQLRCLRHELLKMHPQSDATDAEEDRQCQLVELSTRIQKSIAILSTSFYGQSQTDSVIQQATDVVCRALLRELMGARPTDDDVAATRQLGTAVIAGRFAPLADLQPTPVLMPYESNDGIR